jgi:Nucleotidyltransferase domain
VTQVRDAQTLELYRRNYPPLLRTLERLAERARRDDPNIALLALFGSVARLEPHVDSDADVLILVDDPDRYLAYKPAVPGAAEWGTPARPQGGALVVAVGDAGRRAPWPDGGGAWDLSVLLGDAHIVALANALRADLARDGVLLYRRATYDPPAPLHRLHPFDAWRARVRALLEQGVPA